MLTLMRFDLRNPAFAGVSFAERYAATLEMAEWADKVGAIAVSLSEHHGSEDGYMPSPLIMASAIASRTSNVMVAINAMAAPFHDPIRLAEDIAVLDQIANGRLAVTFGAGYVEHEFEMFGVDPSERPARMTETINTLRAAWTGEPFEYRGRTVRVTPTPAQEGGPALVMGGSSEGAARRAARIADGFIPSDPGVWKYYRDECIALGQDDPGPGMERAGEVTILAEDPEAAWPVLAPYFLHECNAYAAWDATAAAGDYKAVDDIDELREQGQYRVLTPDDYRAEMEPQGDFALAVLHPMVGGIPPALAWEHLHLYQESFL